MSRGAFLLCKRFALARGDLCRHGKTHEKIFGAEARSLRCCSAPRSWCPTSRAQTPPASSAPTPVYKDVVDEAGRTVRVPQPVQRIVSLAPSLTETIYALGLQDRLVGDTDYCDYPPDAQKKTKVGGAINPSLEQIVALRPDLVLVTKSLNLIETVNALDNLGISSYGTDPHTVQEIISSTERLAGVLGVPEAGATLGADLERHLADLQQRLNGLPPRRVLFIVWSDPLISVGKGTFIADAMRLAGATSIVDSAQDWPHMSLEEVVRLQPEFLVFADGATFGPGTFCTVTNSLHIQSVSTSPIITLSGVSERAFFSLSEGSQFQSAGTAPFISVQSDTAEAFFILQFGTLLNAGSAVVDMPVNGALTFIVIDDLANVTDDSISGSSGTILRYAYASSSYIAASRSQSAFTGTLVTNFNFNRQANMVFSPNFVSGPSTYDVAITDSFISINATAGDATVNLPDATTFAGRQLIFSRVDASANNATITAIGGQTINGEVGSNPTYLLNGSYVSITIISDFTNWIIVGSA